LSRSCESRPDKRPNLSDLRGSGAIEQDADIVFFLYREEYYNKGVPPPVQMTEVIVDKNRDGASGSEPVRFLGEYMDFVDITDAEYKAWTQTNWG